MKYLFLIILLVLVSCQTDKKEVLNQSKENTIFKTNKPFARYWWFASEIKKEDIKYNLDWLHKNGFGGVEIAWVYPLNAMHDYLDSAYTPRQAWLSPEWRDKVEYAMVYCDSIGLICDLTMGTLWPFGDSYVNEKEASRQFDGEKQVMVKTWEHPKEGLVVDHLDSINYMKYFRRIFDSFPQPKLDYDYSYFIDSWEVETKFLWSDEVHEIMSERYKNLDSIMENIYNPGYEKDLYQYRKLVSEKVVEFYKNYNDFLNSHGILSRGQCSGAPVDIIDAYSQLDIPEGESLLYEPEYNSIPASAAFISNKPLVTSETFTCIYGWPRDYIREEQTADLKLLADALFANGINHIIWHGKAHNHKNTDSTNFYATVHLGEEGNLIKELEQFNEYLTKVSSYMKKGKTYSKAAVYLPQEDAWIKGIMPKEKQFKWAWGWYEMRYIYFPDELRKYAPTWVNKTFLKEASVENMKLTNGNTEYDFLYIDANYLDFEVLKELMRIAKNDFPVFIINKLKDPENHSEYEKLFSEIVNMKNVKKEFEIETNPLINSSELHYWCREKEDKLYVFISNPKSNYLKFPLEYGQSLETGTQSFEVIINYKSPIEYTLKFEPYQSILLEVSENEIKEIDIKFVPDTPVVKSRPEDYEAPWLIK